MIRKARPDDLNAIVALALEALRIDAYEELVIDPERVRAMARECVSAATNFLWVSEIDGEIVGAIGALVTPNLFHERSCANVMMWYCKRPGDGVALMLAFLRWARSRPAIKMIQYTAERNADHRIGEFLERAGLRLRLPLYVQMK